LAVSLLTAAMKLVGFLLQVLKMTTARGMTAQASASLTSSLDTGLATPDDTFWLEAIKHQGKAAYNPDPSNYQVFRNVKEFGAKGDGLLLNRSVSRLTR
jgi:hypothetical protein